jgi:type IV pilus assembly protein PilA
MKSMKMMKKQAQAGFTLIELMIVVAIIGILAAVAIPQYSDYTVKAKMSNVLTSVESLKTAIAVCAQEAGGSPANCAPGTNGVPAFVATKEVTGVAVDANGKITATLATGLGSGVDGGTVDFTPAFGTPDAPVSAVKWTVTPSSSITNNAAKTALTKNNTTAPVAST